MGKELSKKALEVLSNITVSENTVKLPEGLLDRATYVEVKNSLESIGGKWKSGKIQGFVFEEDPKELILEIQGGKKRNLKKEYQCFETSEGLSDELVQLAEINSFDEVLEPSAGRGRIIRAIHKIKPNKTVSCFELWPLNVKHLMKIKAIEFLGNDFLLLAGKFANNFDKIIANPPFSKNQDIFHIRTMYSCLAPKGRLVSIASKHWQDSSNKVETEFRNWLKEVNATVIEVEAGRFKESGTSIATCIIVINK